MSKWADWAIGEFQEAFPDLKAGKCNCRKISGSNRWSQHAYCNALDIYHADWGYSLNPTHQAWLDEVHAFIMEHFDDLSLRTVIWRKKDHFNHIHIDPYPKGYSTPVCKGGTSRWQWPDGHVETLSKWGSPDPINGYPELPDGEPKEIDYMNQTIAKGASGFEVAFVQQQLIDLGYDLGNWDPFDGTAPTWWGDSFEPGADGAAGNAFQQAVTKFQGDNSLIVNGVVDGVTASFLTAATAGEYVGTPNHTHNFMGETGANL